MSLDSKHHSPRDEAQEHPPMAEEPIFVLLDSCWYEPNTTDLRHNRQAAEVGFCLEGVGSIGLDGRRYAFERGSVVIMPRGISHVQQSGGTQRAHWLYLILDQDRLLRKQTDAGSTVLMALRQCFATTWRNGAYLRLTGDDLHLLTMTADLFVRQGEGLYRQAVQEATVYYLLTALTCVNDAATAIPEDTTSVSIEPVKPALMLIGSRYAGGLRMEELARACGMSESYFRKTFAALLGCSPLEYLNRYRIQQAINQMRTTSQSLICIAMSCGFSSISTFNRNFLQYTGLNPTQWRSENINKRTHSQTIAPTQMDTF